MGLLSAPRPSTGVRYDYVEAPPELVARAAGVADVAERHGVDLPTAAVAYPLRRSEITAVVAGMRTAEQVHSTVRRHRVHVPDAMWAELVAERLVRE